MTSHNNMFYYCRELVGGNGTKFNSSYTNKTYAHIDTPVSPGYLTYKEASTTASTSSAGALARAARPIAGVKNVAAAVALLPAETDAETEKPVTATVTATSGSRRMSAPAARAALPAGNGTFEPAILETAAVTASSIQSAAGDDKSVVVAQTTSGEFWNEESGVAAGDAFDQWVRGEDGAWVYRFRVYEQAFDYTVWEEALAGYQADGYSYTIVDADGVEHTVSTGSAITVPYNPANKQTTVTVTNKPAPNDPKHGSLTISKTIVPGEGNVTVNAEDKEKTFPFEVTVTGVTLNPAYYGELMFLGNKATVELKHGQSVTATGLPIGASVTVTEINWGEYTPVNENATQLGTITEENKNLTFAFENKKTTVDEPEPEYASLTIEKTVTGKDENVTVTEDDKARLFTFTITQVDTNGVEPVDGVYGGLVFTNGVATAYLKDGDRLEITGLPEGAKFNVSETDYTNFEPTISGDGTSSVVFDNVKQEEDKFGAFTLQKIVSGKQPEEGSAPFEFKIELAGLMRNLGYSYTVDDGEAVDFTASNDGTASLTVALCAGQAATFEGLPEGATYMVTETACHYYASYEVTSEDGEVAKADGSNRGADQPLSTATETVEANEAAEIVFTNRNVTFEVEFAKFDEDFTYLGGAVLQVLDAKDKNNVIAQWTTSGDGVDRVEVPEGTFILHELTPPEGYGVAEDQYFTVDRENGVTPTDKDGNALQGEAAEAISLIDPKTKVSIEKRDDNGHPLSGATLRLLDGATVLEEWESGDETHTIKGGRLSVDTVYTLREIKSPDGYLMAADIYFKLARDGWTVAITDKDGMEIDAGDALVKVSNNDVDKSVIAYTIVMTDYPGTELPHTGGEGTERLTRLGVSLIVTAGFAFAWLRIARKRGEDEK